MIDVIKALIADVAGHNGLDDGEAALRLVVDGAFSGAPVEGIVTLHAFGGTEAIGLHRYEYTDEVQRRTGYVYKVVSGVDEVPYFIDPARIIAARHADDLPPA